jgi:hypothetical protein
VLDDEGRDHDPFAREPVAIRRHRVVPGVDRLDAGMSHQNSD